MTCIFLVSLVCGFVAGQVVLLFWRDKIFAFLDRVFGSTLDKMDL
jgi:hypothetical protein